MVFATARLHLPYGNSAHPLHSTRAPCASKYPHFKLAVYSKYGIHTMTCPLWPTAHAPPSIGSQQPALPEMWNRDADIAPEDGKRHATKASSAATHLQDIQGGVPLAQPCWALRKPPPLHPIPRCCALSVPLPAHASPATRGTPAPFRLPATINQCVVDTKALNRYFLIVNAHVSPQCTEAMLPLLIPNKNVAIRFLCTQECNSTHGRLVRTAHQVDARKFSAKNPFTVHHPSTLIPFHAFDMTFLKRDLGFAHLTRMIGPTAIHNPEHLAVAPSHGQRQLGMLDACRRPSAPPS